MVAKDVEVDQHKRVAKLLGASLINGAQTLGVLEAFFDKPVPAGETRPPVSVKFEIVVAEDEELIGEISISRNSQNNVDL